MVRLSGFEVGIVVSCVKTVRVKKIDDLLVICYNFLYYFRKAGVYDEC